MTRHLKSGLTRRTALKLAVGAAAVPLVPGAAFAAQPRHGLSIFGDLGKPADFASFGYVNVNAPKGGGMSMLAPNWGYNQNPQTFNTLNGYVTKGDAAPRQELTLDSLMVGASDEPDSIYGLVAQSVAISDDRLEYTFFLRDGSRFHDGSPLTAEDVVWSIETLKEKGHPDLRLSLADVEGAEAPDARTVIVRFSQKASAQLPLSVAGLPIFSKSWWADKDFEASTLTPVLGSGPYKVGRFETGLFIEYERVRDYWGADLPVRRGHFNIDVIRIEFFRDRTTGFEAFKKGNITLREEFTSKTWATGYDFPAVADGRVVKMLFPAETRPKAQAWFFNTRREKFADPRTREAIGLAFDFEWVNQNLFFGAYQRSASFFQTSVYQADGPPDPDELALLEPLRGQIPDTVFGEAVTPPPSDGSGRDRNKLRRAVKLLTEAGWTRKGSGLVNDKSEALTIEFLINAPIFERVLGKFVESLKSIGVSATIRLVDPAQFQSRLTGFDFDIVGRAFSLSATPFEAARNFFHSASAATPGGANIAGINSPAVDRLVEAVLAARDRDSHRAALRSLDRVVRAAHYTIPNWFSPHHRMAFWNQYSWPETKPDYGFSPEAWWWYEEEKAKRIGKAE
jgi:microcin C transport system substrate-binding protein